MNKPPIHAVRSLELQFSSQKGLTRVTVRKRATGYAKRYVNLHRTFMGSECIDELRILLGGRDKRCRSPLRRITLQIRHEVVR